MEIQNVSGILLNADCLIAMQEIPDNSISMVLTDLPYSQLNRSNPNAAWDVELPLDKLWEQWLRICKENAAIVLFGQGMFTAKLMMSQPKLWRYNLIWDKGRITGFLNARRMPLRCHEDIVVFYRKLPVYHPQMVKCEPYQRNHDRGGLTNGISTNRCYGKYGNAEQIISDEKYPRSIIRVNKEHKVGFFYQECQKPVELLRWLIRTYSDENDIVLDCTAGSMSTAVAAIREHRRYIMIEKDDRHFEVGAKRVREAEASQKLILTKDDD